METFKFLMTPEEEKYVSRGAKLFKDMPKLAHKMWTNWQVIGSCLAVGSKHASLASRTNNRQDPRYKKAFRQWMEENGYGRMDPPTRSRLVYLFVDPEAREALDMVREAATKEEKQNNISPQYWERKVKAYLRKLHGEDAQRKAKKLTEAKAKDALIADLEEKLAAADVDPQAVAIHYLSRLSPAALARLLAKRFGNDRAAAEAFIETLRSTLADAASFETDEEQ